MLYVEAYNRKVAWSLLFWKAWMSDLDAMSSQEDAPNPVGQLDARVLIGWAAIIEGESMVGGIPDGLLRKLRARLVDSGLLVPGATDEQFQHSVNNLNYRLRYVLGEDDGGVDASTADSK